MSYLSPSTSYLQSTERIGQGAISDESQPQSPRVTSIHFLDDDSLLHVFYLYRPPFFGEDHDEDAHIWGGDEGWARGRWWYKLVHVCRRWRTVILGSASYLGVSLICTEGTRVADMLANSPPLPLVIDYRFYNTIAEDEQGIIRALNQHDRVYRIRVRVPVTSLQKVIVAMDEEYPILEHLIIELPIEDISHGTSLTLPEALRAPHLRHLSLSGFALPIGSRLFTAAVSLLTLCLVMVHPSTYFHPNTLLQWLSCMPQLETLLISHLPPVSNHDVEVFEGQLTNTPVITPVTLLNLHRFTFQGPSTYLEAVVHRITTPRLEKLEFILSLQPTFSVPHLLHFINTTENLRFDSALLSFSDEGVAVAFYLGEVSEVYAVAILVECWHLDRQVSSMAQISDSLSQVFSAAEHLTLRHDVDNLLPEEHDGVDRRTEWRKFLSSFKNVKTLWIDYGLVEELSRCLRSDDGEPPLELLPELQELRYSGSGDTGNPFSSFINARQIADRPVTLVRRGSSPSPDPSPPVLITMANEAGSDRDT